MSLPNMKWGPAGEQFKINTSKIYPYGTMLVLQDGRKYRYAEAGGTTIAAGRLCAAEAPGANFDETDLDAAVVGARAITFTNGVTDIAVNDFLEGYLSVEDDT